MPGVLRVHCFDEHNRYELARERTSPPYKRGTEGDRRKREDSLEGRGLQALNAKEDLRYSDRDRVHSL